MNDIEVERINLESILLYRIWDSNKNHFFILMEGGELEFLFPMEVTYRGVEK